MVCDSNRRVFRELTNNFLSSFALSMRNKQPLICFLLGYLVLLWNLGPSFHRADCFGFHCVGHSQTNASFEFEQGSCCHCHCHSHSVPEQSDEPTSNSSIAFGSHHDCAFCQFFDQLHVMLSHAEITEAEDRVFIDKAVVSVWSNAALFSPSARGPPATC